MNGRNPNGLVSLFANDYYIELNLVAFNLLIALLEAGELPQEIIEKGFEQIKAKIHDVRLLSEWNYRCQIELDNPLARTTLENFFVFEAKKAGIVPEQFTIIPSEDD